MEESNERGCMFQDSKNTKDEMLCKIMELKFSIQELALYLDTHPECMKALCLHREYCRELKDIMDKYQRAYGPLTTEFPCNKWRWIEEPWPWEMNMTCCCERRDE